MTTDKKRNVEHFSQANPSGHRQDDVSSLLHRVAETLEKIGPVDVQDLILHTETTADGPWHSITVYFRRIRTTRAKKRKRSKVVPEKRLP